MITSSANPTIKRIRALRQRKERDARGVCFIEGIRLVAEAAQLGARLELLVVAPALLSSPFARELVAAQARAGVAVAEVSAEVFADLSQKDGPQGLGAVVGQAWRSLDQAGLTDGCWVALDRPADPGNLGTIIRTADATGAAGVIIIGSGADPYDPAALRASMGAAFAVPLVRAGEAEFLAWRAERRPFLLGTSDAAPAGLWGAALPQPLVLLMGSEREGMSPALQAACDQVVALPMLGRSDSLNLAVATGVVLYELLRRRVAP